MEERGTNDTQRDGENRPTGIGSNNQTGGRETVNSDQFESLNTINKITRKLGSISFNNIPKYTIKLIVGMLFFVTWMIGAIIVHSVALLAYAPTMVFPYQLVNWVFLEDITPTIGVMIISVILAILSLIVFKYIWSYTSGLGYLGAASIFERDPLNFTDGSVYFGKYSRWGRWNGDGGVDDVQDDMIDEFIEYDKRVAHPSYETDDAELIAALYLTEREREAACCGGVTYDQYLATHHPNVDTKHTLNSDLQKRVYQHYNKGTLNQRNDI